MPVKYARFMIAGHDRPLPLSETGLSVGNVITVSFDNLAKAAKFAAYTSRVGESSIDRNNLEMNAPPPLSHERINLLHWLS